MATLVDNLVVSYKTNLLLPCDPAVVLLVSYSKGAKTYAHTKACTQMFIATLFIIVKTWKQSRCPSVGEWIYKLVEPYNRIFNANRK